MVVRKAVSKRRPSAVKSSQGSQKKDKLVSCPSFLWTLKALRCDIERASTFAWKLWNDDDYIRNSDSEDEETEDEDDSEDDYGMYGGGLGPNRRRNGRKMESILDHIKTQINKLEEEICTFGQMCSKWQTHKLSRSPEARSNHQCENLMTTVSSFCQNTSGRSVEFSRSQVPIPRPSVDAIRMHVYKRLKLKHPYQVKVKGVGCELEQDMLPSKPKVTQVVAKSGRSMLQVHYPVRFSVCPYVMQVLVLDVVAFRALKRDRSANMLFNDGLEEHITFNLSAMLEDVARRHAEGHGNRKATRRLSFSIARQVDKRCEYIEGLLEEEHGRCWQVLQVRDHSKNKEMLMEVKCEEMGVATLQGGGNLNSLQEAAKKQITEVTLTEAFSGNHVLDLKVMSSDSVIDIKSKVLKKLDASLNVSTQIKFINGAGMVLDNHVKASDINNYLAPMRPVSDDAAPQRVLKLEVRKTSATHQTSLSAQSEAKARGSAKVNVAERSVDQSLARARVASAGRVACGKSECFGLVFIEEHAIVLTKSASDAEKLAEALVRARPEMWLHADDDRERYQMKTVAEMLGIWCREKHLVKK